METTERLYRVKTNKVIGGVASGLAEYFDIDVVLARVVFVLLALFGGSGGIIYIVMWIIIPARETYSNNSQNREFESKGSTNESDLDNTVDEASNEIVADKKKKKSNSGLAVGIVLIFIGLLFLVDRLMPWYNITDFWPLLLVIVGVLMIKPDIFKPTKKQSNEI
jgi:phage shock protein PspC (stress-responsive transcriptional regulator)